MRRNHIPIIDNFLKDCYLQLVSAHQSTLLSTAPTFLLPDTAVINDCHTRLASTCAWNGKITHKFIESHEIRAPDIRTRFGRGVCWLHCDIHLRVHVNDLLEKLSPCHSRTLAWLSQWLVNIIGTHAQNLQEQSHINTQEKLNRRLSGIHAVHYISFTEPYYVRCTHQKLH